FALAMLEEAAASVLYQLRLNTHELLLEQKSRRLIALFQELARAYLNTNKVLDALEAVETLRAATIRSHTISDVEQSKRAKQGMGALADHLSTGGPRLFFDVFLNDRTAVEPVERLLPSILGLRKALA